MGFAVYHVQKGSGSGSGLGHHIDRTEGKEHLYPHADPSKTSRNWSLDVKYQGTPLTQAINSRIQEGYKGNATIRKDAVKYLTHVLTGSHDDMKAIFKNKETAEAWIRENYNFMIENFGAENIVRFTLHLDEKTPHIHCVTVPLTSDGRLSAKEMVGNNKRLQQMQDQYADRMKQFNLQRGVRGTTAKHKDVKVYYSEIPVLVQQKKAEIRALESEISELSAELQKLSAKDVLTSIFKPKAKEKELLKQVDELSAELQSQIKSNAEIGRLLNDFMKREQRAGAELDNAKMSLKNGLNSLLNQINDTLRPLNLVLSLKEGKIALHQITDRNKGMQI